jgi:hypothetical protein
VKPLQPYLNSCQDSWEMLGTNLSSRKPDGSWHTATERLLLFDQKDFNQLGLGIDDLIDGYLQAVFAAVAIDNLQDKLTDPVTGYFDLQKYAAICADQSLLNEVLC